MSYSIQNIESSEQNKMYLNDTSIHNWYRFVLSFPPHLVRNYLNEFDIKNGDTVLDPFCGTGTTLVECKKNNIKSVGIEANNMAFFASRTKVNWDIDIDLFLKEADKIARNVENKILSHKGELFKLSEAKEKLLIKNSISSLPLHKAILLYDEIKKKSKLPFFDHYRLAFSKKLVNEFSNLHFGPEVGVSRKKKQDADVIREWIDEINNIAYDLKEFSGAFPSSKVLLNDSRSEFDDDKIDAVITSPPYPNEKDYTRTTRLESVLLEFVNSKEELRDMKKKLLRSNTRNVYKGDKDNKYIENNERIMSLSKKIEDKRIMLNKTSGFEKYYHKVVQMYFGGMYQHLKFLKPKLKKGAKLAYVVGDQASYFRVLIKTGEILAEISEELGYKVIRIDTFRTRLSTVTKHYLNEEVLILENK